VQGVGFRYTALSIAQDFSITGWVRNLEDGRVELVAEGSEAELERYLEKIQDAMSGYISKLERAWEAPSGQWNRFSIATY
jgi:acylphosphatase